MNTLEGRTWKVALVLILMRASLAQADTVFLQNDVLVYAGAGTPITISQATSPWTGTSGPLTSNDSSTRTACGGTMATASMSGSANFGALQAQGNGNTVVPNGGCGQEDPMGSQNTGGTPVVSYQDVLTINSTSLAVGTPINVQISEMLSGSVTQSGFFDPRGFNGAYVNIYGSYNIAPVSSAWQGTLQGDISGYNANQDGTNTINSVLTLNYSAVVGEVFYLDTSMFATANADADQGEGPVSVSFDTNLDTCVDVLTPGASYSSQSGAGYCSEFANTAVPEPSSFLMLGMGVIGLCGIMHSRLRRMTQARP